MNTKHTPGHTPGPWTEGTGWIMAANGRKVCADFPAVYRDDGESEANMRLIAAAPEMLDALKAIAKDSREGYAPMPTWEDMRAVRAAILKATGAR